MRGRQSITVPLVILLFGCGADPADSAGPKVAVHGRYVLLASSPAGKPVAFARVIVDADQPCPTIIGEATLPMSARDNPHGFSVKVCEAVVPFDKQLEVPIGDATLSLPVAKPDPVRILAMGDTGCQANDCQPGKAAEPFATLASSATAGDWDVILHMGNYNFRGTPSKDSVTEERIYDAGDGTAPGENCLQAADSGFVSQNAPGSGPRDHWGNWRDEFFAPAGELLWSAPWIFARGNRELCSRAGPGWFYFLDPSSNLREGGGKQLSCPVPDAGRNPINNVVLLDPYRVDLGTLNLVVLDSANACDAFATPPMRDFTNTYIRHFAQLRELAPTGRSSWLMTHRPVWGVQPYKQHKSTACTEANQYGCVNQVMQHAIRNGLGGKMPRGIKLSLAGHMPHFQSLTFPGSARPAQLIIGHSGGEPEARGPAGSFEATIQGAKAQGTAISRAAASGFLQLTYAPDGSWEGSVEDLQKSVELASCGSRRAANGNVCEFVDEPSSAVTRSALD